MKTWHAFRFGLANMPVGISALFLMQMASVLSFSVLYSTLVLYMKGRLGMEASLANSIMGVFIAFNFGMHLLGGYWGGRLFSYRFLFCVGMIALILGCILLSFDSLQFFYYGLAAFLTGSGLNVTCINCMLTQRFTPEDTRRETAFLWNYAGMNVGFFVGFSISGFFQIRHDYHSLFLISSMANVLALILCLSYWKQLADIDTIYARKTPTQKKRSIGFGIPLVLILPLLLNQLLHFDAFANRFVLFVGVSMLGLLLVLAKQQAILARRKNILAFGVFTLVSTLFWTLYQIIPMGLTVFIENNVQRTIGSLVIPPQWFQNINTIIIIIGGPALGLIMQKLRHKGYDINTPTQFSCSLLLIGLGFILLPVGIAWANAQGLVNINWIVANYVLQSFAELLISPIGYAMVGALAPPELQGLMMGMWMLNSGVGATLASYSSNFMIQGKNSAQAIATNAGFSEVFLVLGAIAIVAGLIMVFFIPTLRRLIQAPSKTDIAANQARVLV